MYNDQDTPILKTETKDDIATDANSVISCDNKFTRNDNFGWHGPGRLPYWEVALTFTVSIKLSEKMIALK